MPAGQAHQVASIMGDPILIVECRRGILGYASWNIIDELLARAEAVANTAPDVGPTTDGTPTNPVDHACR